MKPKFRNLLLIAIAIIISLCFWGCDLISSLFGGDKYLREDVAMQMAMTEEAELEDYFVQLDENEFKSFKPNQFKNVLNSPFSTFGADVDTASYSILRYYIQRRNTVPTNQLLRTEEMLNYFKYDYPSPREGEPFAITTELVNTPWNQGTQLLLIGMQAPKLKEIPRSNIVFLVDISGSMNNPEKLPLLQDSILASLSSFTENDRISIVVYADGEKVILSGANPASDKIQIEEAVRSLRAEGATNGERGLEMAYDVAEKYFIPGGNNRIIMGTDGDLNVGISSENELKAFVEKKREKGIFLSILGFGFGNLKDNRMETLADNGNGSYHYIDSINEAKRVLVEDRESTLFTSAKDVKFQVEFNPAKVKGYRLIGYETRVLDTEDFKNDKKDGGEIGANQQMTALYEIVPVGSDIEVAKVDITYQKIEVVPLDDLATLTVRYKKPNEDASQEIKRTISSQVSEQLSENIQFAAAVAEVGMLLNNSEFKGSSTYGSVLELLKPLNSVKTDPYRAEFYQMISDAFPQLRADSERQQEEMEKQLKQKEITRLEFQKRQEELAKKGKPVVSLKTPKVTGNLDKRIIQKVVLMHNGELRACYEKALQKDVNLSGKIVVGWIISPQGSTAKVVIKESAVNNQLLEECVTNAIKFWRFPAPKGGGEVSIEYPMQFELVKDANEDMN